MMVPVPQTLILVAEDEQTILDLLSASLRHAGFVVIEAVDGDEALRLARAERPDVLLLDVMMPGHDGFDVVRTLRTDGINTPVLFVTARGATQDKIQGLTDGGDDYVTKPFSLDEVHARIRALLRRSGGRRTPVANQILRFADIELDVDRHQVYRNGENIDLTPTEFNMLRLFLENPNRVLSKQVIVARVWDHAYSGDPAIVESYMSYLRRKVDAHGPSLLHTVRGVGYVLKVRD